MQRIRMLACLCALAGLAPGLAAAHGALAIGLPANVASEGVAIGFSYNYESRDGADARALKECLSFMDAPPSTRKLCKLIESFSRQCIAIALDPGTATPSRNERRGPGYQRSVIPAISARSIAGSLPRRMPASRSKSLVSE